MSQDCILVSVLIFSVLFSSIPNVFPQRIRDKMYEPIEGASACFRRLNGTHQFGCSSHRSGNVGVVQFVESDSDLAWLVENATVSPYMAVLEPHMFTKDVLWKLKTSGKVNGVVLINNSTNKRPSHFSHEDKCPNRYSGLSLVHEPTCNNSYPWNKYGTGISMIDWGFPIFHVGDDENISKLYQCYWTHNAQDRDMQLERSLCALEMKSFMLAAVDSKTCIRRSSATTILDRVNYCDPLGDRNIWATLYPRYKPEKKNNTVVVVAARLDGTSMFDGLVPGAMSPVSGIVTLLMTARILARMVEQTNGMETQQEDNVMFVLLNGESYDYIGSSRLLWDMKHGVFPMKPDSDVKVQPPPFHTHNIKLFLELGQISTQGTNETEFYVHQYEHGGNKIISHNVISSFLKELNKTSQNTSLKFQGLKKENSLPPSSLQSVLAASPDTPGVVLTNHESQFLNKYYHSIMDDSTNLMYTYQNGSTPSEDSIQTVVAKLSTVLAETLYKLTVSEVKVPDVPKPNPHLVDELFHCYLDTMDCSIFQAVSYKQKLDTKPPSMYVGVSVWLSQITTLTAQSLALLINHIANKTEESCHSDPSDKVFSYIWMQNVIDGTNASGVCIKTTMNFSSAVSPAFFEEPEYDWSSGSYSTWTESVWREFSVRMFLKPSRFHENLTFALGVVVLALSFLIVYFANSQSHILFGNTLVTSGC